MRTHRPVASIVIYPPSRLFLVPSQAGDSTESGYLSPIQRSVRSARQLAQLDRAECGPLQCPDLDSQSFHHAADFAIPPFVQLQLEYGAH